MTTSQINGQSLNQQEELLKLLQEEFPEVISEGKIDSEKLRQTLGEKIDVGSERYGLSWSGKSNCFREIQKTTSSTLEPTPEESVNFDSTNNIFIEGDNLEVLRVLQRSYYGKVKMIYIDPPYNTGNDFIYNDNFKQDKTTYQEESGQRNNSGDLLKDSALRRNSKDNGHYHSDWLSMMYPRLFLARNLLRRDGIIFTSIDDHEVHNLKLIMDEIFGEENFIADIAVVNNLKGRNDKKYIATAHERLLIYVKSYEFEERGFDLPENRLGEFNLKDEIGSYRLLGLRKRGGADTRIERPNMYFPLYVNPKTGAVSTEKDDAFSAEVLPLKSDGTEGCWRWGLTTVRRDISSLEGKPVANSQGYDVFEKDYLETNGEIRRMKPKSIMMGTNYSTDGATKYLRELLGGPFFDNPKSVFFLTDLVKYATFENDIILDFFAGSGTLGEAVWAANSDDGAERNFILVQIEESVEKDTPAYEAGYKNIPSITRERLKRASKKRQQGQIEFSKSKEELDLGFKCFKLRKSNFAEWRGLVNNSEEFVQQLELSVENIKPDSKQINILSELLLKSGLELTAQVNRAEKDGVTYFIVADNLLIVCLDGTVTGEFIEYLEQLKPAKVIFLEKVFANNDDLKTNTILNLERAKIDFKVI